MNSFIIFIDPKLKGRSRKADGESADVGPNSESLAVCSQAYPVTSLGFHMNVC